MEERTISFMEFRDMFCEVWRKFIRSSDYATLGLDKLPLLHKVMHLFCNDERLAKIMFERVMQEFSIGKLTDTDWKAMIALFKSAKNDLKIAKSAYEIKSYDMVVYHIQQSVEKLTKYWLMRFNGFTYSEIKSIGHKTPFGYLQWISNFLKVFMDSLEKIARETKISDEDEKFLTDIKTWRRYTENLKKRLVNIEDRVTIFSAPASEIIERIKLVDTIYDEFLERYRKFSREFQNSEFLKYALSMVGDQISNEEISELMEYAKTLYELLLKTLYLYMLGAYTYVHEAPSRYYDTQIRKSPSDYNEELGIIQTAPEIFKRIEAVILIYEQFEKVSESFRKLIEEEDKNARVGRV